MGITLNMIQWMHGMGVLGSSGANVLDIGSSNLYGASKEGVKKFLSDFGVQDSKESDEFAEKMETGSRYDPVTGGVNDTFVGELLEAVNVRYEAIDIADGYRTTILDLNHSSVPDEFEKVFDLVMNFGTTEHLLNQYNALKVMHDATKVGGYMIHQLPFIGYSNHGYFTYTPRCLFDVASYNKYEMISFGYDGPAAGHNDLYASLKDYSSYFPELSTILEAKDSTSVGKYAADFELPDISLTIVLKKVKDRPFVGALEQSTSVGYVPFSVTSAYKQGPKAVLRNMKKGILHKLRYYLRG